MNVFKTLMISVFAVTACTAEKPTSTDPEASPKEEKKEATTQPAEGKMADEKKAGDIVAVATEAGQFTTLAKALTQAGLVDTLKGKGPFTVFAPTDAAFGKLEKGVLESLMKPESKDKLTQILSYHVVAGKVPASKVTTMDTAETVAGPEIDIAVKDGKVMLNGSATVVKTDIEASNGLIHVIDRVIMPPK
ncbi:MAG TPA: fasciclin domain-containing protein [Myxococcales bacterium LLY-WYZ-16_1]|jgi:uncharacterized surface protein with fasciclin (FAS1) repeats|nr:fasciclin domain-containing protein [Myxococcales bacterium LLY-WYZ-16_1]